MILKLDFSSSVPIYQQIRNQIVVGIAEGKLQAGEKLPTIRALAEESGINMMTVSKAYQMLKQEGYIQTDRRSGAVITSKKNIHISEESIQALKVLISELHVYGMSEDEVLKLCSDLYREV